MGKTCVITPFAIFGCSLQARCTHSTRHCAAKLFLSETVFAVGLPRLASVAALRICHLQLWQLAFFTLAGSVLGWRASYYPASRTLLQLESLVSWSFECSCSAPSCQELYAHLIDWFCCSKQPDTGPARTGEIMLHNAATYIFGGFSGVVAIGLATWQVGKHFSEGLASLQSR